MKHQREITITASTHAVDPGSVIVLCDGREFDVVDVDGGTVRIRRRSWWRHMLRRLWSRVWPFHFRGFWRRVWDR